MLHLFLARLAGLFPGSPRDSSLNDEAKPYRAPRIASSPHPKMTFPCEICLDLKDTPTSNNHGPIMPGPIELAQQLRCTSLTAGTICTRISSQHYAMSCCQLNSQHRFQAPGVSHFPHGTVRSPLAGSDHSTARACRGSMLTSLRK
jgi:hypothetical protein